MISLAGSSVEVLVDAVQKARRGGFAWSIALV
jgi:hypothetical protein